MFGVQNNYQPAFGGVVLANGGAIASIELDGSGKYQGPRKMWRFRLVKGDLSFADELMIRLNNMLRPMRIAAMPDASNVGYVELL